MAVEAPSTPATVLDAELLACGLVIRALKALPADARARVILLVVRRFGGTFNEQRAIANVERAS